MVGNYGCGQAYMNELLGEKKLMRDFVHDALQPNLSTFTHE